MSTIEHTPTPKAAKKLTIGQTAYYPLLREKKDGTLACYVKEVIIMRHVPNWCNTGREYYEARRPQYDHGMSYRRESLYHDRDECADHLRKLVQKHIDRYQSALASIT